MKVTIVGGGYVGLVSGAAFSHIGHEVMIVEKSKEKLKLLRKGTSPIFEPGLDELLREGISKGSLHFTNSLKEGVKFSNVIFICVGTPPGKDGYPDMSQVEEVVRGIAESMDSHKVIVEKSTVPVNTHKKIAGIMHLYGRKDEEFDIVSNPEFLREGKAIEDFLNPKRIIIGTHSEKAKAIMDAIYEPIIKKGTPVIHTDPATAEITKYAANAFLATKISFINMVSDMCEVAGADISKVAEGLGLDPRIGKEYLKAGIGWGGSCLPKDLKAFIRTAEEFSVDFSLLKEVEKINEARIERLLGKARKILWTLKNKNIAVWGLAFKPDTDDVRESPSLRVIKRLLEEEARVKVYDPKAMERFKQACELSSKVIFAKNKYEALKEADLLLILTEWEEFKNADLSRIRKEMKLPVIIDGRNIFKPEKIKESGIKYYPVGKNLTEI